jgi:shikimate 5-dehydrogenase
VNRVIVFGAGLVVRAHVRYLLDHGFHVTVASRTVAKAEAILDGHPLGTPIAFDIEREPERLGALVAEHDLAVSLLPWSTTDGGEGLLAQPQAHGHHLLRQDEMKALNGAAKKAGGAAQRARRHPVSTT